MNYALVLERTACRDPDREALGQGDRSYTYAELADRVRRFGSALRDHGLEPGDRVAILQGNRPEVLETMLGCWHQGLVCVPLNARSTAHEAADMLGSAEPRAIVFDAEYEAHVAAAAPDAFAICTEPTGDGTPSFGELIAGTEPRPAVSLPGSAPAWLAYSSGTTGRMKGITMTHGVLMTVVLSFLAELDHMTSGDVVLHAAPLTHGSGMFALPGLMVGATQLITANRSFTPSEALDLIERRGVTNLAFLAPTMVTRLASAQRTQGADTSSLRCCVYGGAPMYLEDIKTALSTFGPVLAQIFGQAECPVTISRMTPTQHGELFAAGDDVRLGSAGTLYSSADVRIVPAEPGDAQGEIHVRSDAVMAGYWNDPQATASVLSQDGWLNTGDVGRLDADGYLSIVDRTKDMIISGAANVYPREVEEVVLRHPAVQEVCVVGAPDPEWGERIVAVVSLGKSGVDEDVLRTEIDALCRERLSGYKVPRTIEVVDELPKSAYGKILKREVRERFWAGRDRQI